MNPAVVVLGEKTLLSQLRAEVRPQRMASAWIGVFGAIALLLTAIGLYGVVAPGAAMLVAAIVPARRASRLNPVDALRCD